MRRADVEALPIGTVIETKTWGYDYLFAGMTDGGHVLLRNLTYASGFDEDGSVIDPDSDFVPHDLATWGRHSPRDIASVRAPDLTSYNRLVRSERLARWRMENVVRARRAHRVQLTAAINRRCGTRFAGVSRSVVALDDLRLLAEALGLVPEYA